MTHCPTCKGNYWSDGACLACQIDESETVEMEKDKEIEPLDFTHGEYLENCSFNITIIEIGGEE